MMRDGRLSHCKECNKLDSIKNYRRKIQDPKWAAKERTRQREKSYRLHKGRHRNKELVQAYSRRWISKNRYKRQAHSILSYAVRDGRIIKPENCQRCGIKPTSLQLHGHHHDYSKPLEVEWICTTCHGIEHRI